MLNVILKVACSSGLSAIFDVKELMLHCDVKEGDTMKVIVCCYRHKNIYVSKLTTLNCNKRVQVFLYNPWLDDVQLGK